MALTPKPILSGWQDAYVDFVADPTETRTQAQWCKDWDVSWSSVYVWRTKNYDFVYQEADRRRQRYKSQLKEQALKALAKRLEKSDKAIEMALTITGELEAKSNETHVHFSDISEKRAKVKELLSKYQKKEGGSDETPKTDAAVEGPAS